MNKTILGSLVVIVAIAIGGYAFPASVNTVVEKNVSSAVGPDTYFPYVANNDVQKYAGRKSLTTATTTICAIRNTSATSTLTLGSVRLITSTTTESTVTLSRAATAYATTTYLNSATVAANAQASVLAVATSSSNFVFAPNEYFVVGMAGNIGTFSPTGVCQAEFVRI